MQPPGRSAGTGQDLEQDHALEECGLNRHRERSLTVRLAVRRQRRVDRKSRNMCIRPSKYAGGFRATSELREATTRDPQFGPGNRLFQSFAGHVGTSISFPAQRAGGTPAPQF